MYLNLNLLNKSSAFSGHVHLHVPIAPVRKRVEWTYLFLDFIYLKVNLGGIIPGHELWLKSSKFRALNTFKLKPFGRKCRRIISLFYSPYLPYRNSTENLQNMFIAQRLQNKG